MKRRTVRAKVGRARSATAIALAVLCLGAAARARDIVELRGGQSLEGEVIRETEDAVWLKSGSGTIRLDRSRVVRIERDKPLPSWRVRLRRKLAEDRRKRAELAQAAAEKARAERKAEESTEDDEKAERLVADLASDDPETRRKAAALIELEGDGVVPALTKGLFHGNAFARESSARLLGKLEARQSVRQMIIALRSSVPEKEKIRPWQRPFVRGLRASLAATTGQDLGVSLYRTHQGKAVEKYVAWWDGEAPAGEPEGKGEAEVKGEPRRGACLEWDTPQVGEEPIAEDDPEREKKLFEARRIGDERHAYSPPRAFLASPFGDAPEER